jgi:predicted nucleotidyltransferase
VCGGIASATGIRELITKGSDVTHLLPGACSTILAHALAAGHCFDQERFYTALQAFLLQEEASLSGLYQLEHGLARRLIEAAMRASSCPELVDSVKSRQWTRTRIQRLLIYVLLQLKGRDMLRFLQEGPLYLRLLGVSERGRQVLARARKRRTLPVIADPSRARPTLQRFYRGRPGTCRVAERMLACDLRATRLYGLLQAVRPPGHCNRDFFRHVSRT